MEEHATKLERERARERFMEQRRLNSQHQNNIFALLNEAGGKSLEKEIPSKGKSANAEKAQDEPHFRRPHTPTGKNSKGVYCNE